MSNRAERAIRTLSRVDPEFVQLCEVLYGPGIDPEMIYDDVFSKLDNPDLDAQRSATRQRRLDAAGAVIGGASAVLAGNEIAQGVRGTVRAVKAGKLLRVTDPAAKITKDPTLRTGLRRIGVGTVFGAGDVLGAKALEEDARKKPVDKAFNPLKIPRLEEHVAGIRAGIQGFNENSGLGRLMESSAPSAKKAFEQSSQARHRVPVDPKKVQSAKDRGAKMGDFASEVKDITTGTTNRKIGTGVVAGAGYLKLRQNRRQSQPVDLSGYSKRDELNITGTFSKLDGDKRQVFGWASVVEKDGLPVVDRQGDFIDSEEIEKAIYSYVQKSRVGGDMHRRAALADRTGFSKEDDQPHKAGDLIECVVFTKEKKKAMGLDDNAVPDGVWVGYQIHDDETWQAIKNGKRSGFSIHGRGKRVDTTLDAVVGY